MTRVTVRTAERTWRELLRTATSLLHSFEERGDFDGLSTREYDVLRALAETDDGEARLGALAAATYLPQPSMSRLVERMERDGLVARCPAPKDGRGRVVALTSHGRARYLTIARRHVRSIHSALSAALSQQEAEQLAALLHRLRESNDEQTGES